MSVGSRQKVVCFVRCSQDFEGVDSAISGVRVSALISVRFPQGSGRGRLTPRGGAVRVAVRRTLARKGSAGTAGRGSGRCLRRHRAADHDLPLRVSGLLISSKLAAHFFFGIDMMFGCRQRRDSADNSRLAWPFGPVRLAGDFFRGPRARLPAP